MPLLTSAPTVRLELPESWLPVPLAADGDRAGQRALLARWCGGEPPEDLVRRLVAESRAAHRSGVAFAALLLAAEQGPPAQVVTAALTVGFQPLPGAADPRTAAEGVLQVRRAAAAATTRVELVGLAGDVERPAVVVRETGTHCRTEVLWLLPGTDQLAGISVSSEDRSFGPAAAQVAVTAAASLQLA